MPDNSDEDWQIDLKPIHLSKRAAGARPGSRPAKPVPRASTGDSSELLEAIHALRETTDRILVRLAAIEHALAVDASGRAIRRLRDTRPADEDAPETANGSGDTGAPQTRRTTRTTRAAAAKPTRSQARDAR